jgi:protein transport protein SEC31
MQRVKAKAPSSFKTHVTDTEKRLNILFDHLNNQTLLTQPTIGEMVQLAEAVRGKEYDRAAQIQLEILKNRSEECTNWMVSLSCLTKLQILT